MMSHQQPAEAAPPDGAPRPDPQQCVRLARSALASGDPAGAYRWLLRVADESGPYMSWAAAAALLPKLEAAAAPPARRTVRVALTGSYTTSQLAPLLRLAGLRRGLRIDIHETAYDTYAQSLLDPGSELYAFDPDYVILATHEGAVHFPSLVDDVEVLATLTDEVARWRGLWDAVARHSRARVIQHNFVIRPETAWGHVSVRLPGSRDEMLRALNVALAAEAGDGVLVVDCDRVAAGVGKARWFDDRYWHLSKQAVALDAVPELARHTAAMLAAAEGLSSKCIVLDLDNTLWGGVIAEDGVGGIRLGHGPQGEAYVAFQEYLRALRARGVVLAVVSKNNEADAREPFDRHPDMRLKLADISVFIANWNDKAANLRAVAAELGIGLDALVFVDDNPAERQVVRQLLPEVEVVELPREPAGYIRALSGSLLFEAAAVTGEDLARADQYRARAAAAAARQGASSLDDFHRSLHMSALIAPFDELNLPRIVQLIGKTNQFNLTTRRHTLAEVRAFADDERVVTCYLRLRDRFGDHGLVAVVIAQQDGGELEIDTWLMSCRVIGRTVEYAMLAWLCEAALARGGTRLRGTYVPSAKNAVVQDLYARLGFDLVEAADDGSTTWIYDITGKGVPSNEYIGVAGDALVRDA